MKKTFLSLIAGVCITTAFAQIPNAGFENWTSMSTYNNPDNWDQLNAMTSSMSVYTCAKGTPGNPGASYLKLTSKTVTGMGVMPGIATTGTINMMTMSVTGGFAYNQTPQSLTGAWQYMAYGSDAGFIAVYLTKWNSSMGKRDTIAMAVQSLSGMIMSWANFSIDLMYMKAGTPDTAQIILSASGTKPVANSYLYIDNLAFMGVATGIKENKALTEIKLYPNPAGNQLILSLLNSGATKGQIDIFDTQGKKVKSLNNLNFTATTSIDISDLNQGAYFIKVLTPEGMISQKFLKQ
jgi:hypothetical protein